jgi:NADPH2:quinone reductase
MSPDVMRAIVVPEFGDASMLQLDERRPVPAPGPDQVLIAVRCAGVNFAEVMSRRFGYLGVTPPFVPGVEVAGTVVALGDGVEGLAVGDRVCALTHTGGYAEWAVADRATTFAVPPEVDWPVAAALPMILPTAQAVLHELGRVRPADRVLVDAAAGGAGMVIGQLARAAGAHAVGVVSSPGKVPVAERYGFARVVTTDELRAGALDDEERFDLVLDSVGGEAREDGWRVLAPFGTLVAFGNASGAPEPEVGAATLRRGNQSFAGLSITGLAQTHPALLRGIAERAMAAVARGDVAIDISRSFPLARAGEAHIELEGRRSTGKMVLEVA